MPKISTKELTETRIEKLKCGAHKVTGEPATKTYWDSRISGFGVQVTPGGSKTLYFKFVPREGGQCWLKLGKYEGPATLVEARTTAARYRALVTAKKDPRAELAKAKAIPTVEKFVKTFLEGQKEREEAGKIRLAYYEATRKNLENLLVPKYGKFLINEVEHHHMAKLYRETAKGLRPDMKKNEKPKRPTPIAANRLLASLSIFFNAAEMEGLRKQGTNPVELIAEREPEQKKERFLEPVEMEWLGKVMREAPTWDVKENGPRPTAYALAAIKLLLRSGARLNEILQLKWTDVDEEKGMLVIKRHKTSRQTGVKRLPINVEMMAILDELKTIPCEHLNPWVIQGHKHGEHLINLRITWERIKKAVTRASKGAVNIEDVRIHDLRHSFASAGISAGLTLPQLGGLLGHTQAATTMRYAHLLSDLKQKTSQDTSSVISASLGA